MSLLADPERAVENCRCLSRPPGGDQGPAKADLEGDGRRVLRAKLAGPVGEHALEPGERLGRPASGQEGAREVITRGQRVRVTGAEEPVARGGDLVPVRGRERDQVRGLHALAQLECEPVAAA